MTIGGPTSVQQVNCAKCSVARSISYHPMTMRYGHNHGSRVTRASQRKLNEIRATLGENDLAHQPAKALELVDSAVGAIGRMTYSRAAAGFHVLRGVERDEVTKIRCWVDVVLNEILPPT